MNTMTYQPPSKVLCPLEDALKWSPSLLLIQVKADGVFQTRSLTVGGQSFIIAGEFVTRKSGGFLAPSHEAALVQYPGGVFFAFDLLCIGEVDLKTMWLEARWEKLQSIAPHFPPGWFLIEHAARDDKNFVERQWALGAEGVVAKPWDLPYGRMLACKRLQTYHCVVTSMGGTQSVGIADSNGLQDRGRVTLRGGKVDKVRVGSVIKVEAMGQTGSGKLREPRCTEENWLIKF